MRDRLQFDPASPAAGAGPSGSLHLSARPAAKPCGALPGEFQTVTAGTARRLQIRVVSRLMRAPAEVPGIKPASLPRPAPAVSDRFEAPARLLSGERDAVSD